MIGRLLGATASALALTLAACGSPSDPALDQTGAQPDLPRQDQTLIPPMKISPPGRAVACVRMPCSSALDSGVSSEVPVVKYSVKCSAAILKMISNLVLAGFVKLNSLFRCIS